MKSIHILISLSILFVSCQKEEISFSENAKDHFFLKNDNAEMPVWVEGNTLSKTFVLFLHGGPGGSSIGYNELNIFSSLETQYAVVYWDQRCAGASQGNCNPDDLNVNSFVQDLDQLIEVLKYRYGQDISVFLLGDSWGGTLATAYMTTDNLQQKIKGSLVTVGVHNFPLMMQKRQEMLNFYADQQILIGNRVNEWEKIKLEISGIDLTTLDALNILQTHANTAQEYLSELDSIQSITLSGGSPNSLGFSYIINGNITGNVMWPQLLEYDLSDKLSNINVPVSLFYGKYDFIVPPSIGTHYFENLTTTNKELHIIDHADHYLGVTNGLGDFYPKVIAFIEAYK
ncbi:MAG: alpha/beta fold hydrolase [Cyclobacteriaceae bacterium]